jgi:GNAT superfamily N-acetyltransferase
MTGDPCQITLSAIDEERFGIRTARASNVTVEGLSGVLDFCQTNKVILLIARCSTSDTQAAQAMERHGFLLMDTLIYYERVLAKPPAPTYTGPVVVRPLQPEDKKDIIRIAGDSFRKYIGHYHADRRLDRTKCDEAYKSWAARSCGSSTIADEVLVAELNGTIEGFLTLRFTNPQVGEGALFAVAPAAQGLGIGQALMIHAMQWFHSRNTDRMLISTQIINIAAQKSWTRVGFEMSHACYTFHKWFDTP